MNINNFKNHINQDYGFGTIIVKNIVETYNGKFIVESGKDKEVVSTIKIPKVR
ncbi:hypothetical protein [Clostridium sp. Marseille-QA1073]